MLCLKTVQTMSNVTAGSKVLTQACASATQWTPEILRASKKNVPTNVSLVFSPGNQPLKTPITGQHRSSLNWYLFPRTLGSSYF